MRKSWQTTVAGVILVVSGVIYAGLSIFDGNPETAPNLPVITAMIVGGLGLVAASDHNKNGGAR